MRKKVSIIGYGALGKILADGISRKLSHDYEIAGIWSRSIAKHADELSRAGIPFYASFEELLADNTHYVIEIAGTQAVADYGFSVLQTGKNLIITSIGALANQKLYTALRQTAKNHNCKIHLTSGAVGGFDIFQSIRMMGPATARIDNFKAPDSLNGAPYLNGRPLPKEQSILVFEGNAREAIAGFPKNVNVAVASALASVGVDEMQVSITSCPNQERNIHKITVQNATVTATVEVSSAPDPVNPKSSTVTAWSIIALLQNLADPVQLF